MPTRSPFDLDGADSLHAPGPGARRGPQWPGQEAPPSPTLPELPPDAAPLTPVGTASPTVAARADAPTDRPQPDDPNQPHDHDDESAPHGFPTPPGAVAGPPGSAGAIIIDPAIDPAVVPTDGIGIALGDTFRLHSLPGSGYRVFLDFDGHVTTDTAWNGYWGVGSIVSPAFSLDGDGSFSAAELLAMQRIWQRVAEFFSPFNIDVTTEDPGADALAMTATDDPAHGIRVVITDEGGRSSGGIAWVGSFNYAIDTPAFVYANPLGDSVHNIVVAAAHEAGHALGLSHDGRGGSEYDWGHGSGAAAWAPVMGVGYNATVVQWSAGQYAGANNTEDDLAVITTRNYGVAYRADEAGGTAGTAAALGGSVGPDGLASVRRHGVIAQSGPQNDIDRYSFTLAEGGAIDLRVSAWAAAHVGGDPTPVYSALPSGMLDVRLALYRGNTLIAVADDPTRQDAVLTLGGLPGGSYSVAIDGTGWGTPVATTPTGWTEYGSLGQYMITGTYSALPSEDVTPPPAPAILGVTDDAGPILGALTRDTTPTLFGTAEALSIVTLRNGAAVVGSATAAADGTWTITVSALSDGAHSLSAIAADAAGNLSAASDPRALLVDSVAPDAPVVLSAVAGGEGQAPALTGRAEAASLVTLFNHATLLGTTLADATGAWRFATSHLDLPGYRFTATATDAAGNVSAGSLPYAGPPALEVDTLALVLGEAQGTAVLTLRLANVVNAETRATVTLAGLDPTESRVLADTVVLDASNGWSAAVMILGVDDRAADGPRTSTLTVSAPGLGTHAVQVTTLDDEIAAATYTRGGRGTVELAAFAAPDGTSVTTIERRTAAGSYVIDQRWGFVDLAAGDYTVHLTGSATEAMRLLRSLDGGQSWAAVRHADGRVVVASDWDGDYLVAGVADRLMLRLVDQRGAPDPVQDSVTIDLMTVTPLLIA